MCSATVSIHPDVAHGTIRPEVYGHFAEHLGRCVYEGLWVGEGSHIPNDAGIRVDTVEALARINSAIIRWPGGCFADNYHWQDGIGPRDQRPRRPNLWWDQEDTNTYGTDEFLETCRRIGAEPNICANVGSGTPQEALSWLEYCNYAGESTLSGMRAANGHPDPWNVKWWAIGNENWGCGGSFTPRDYGKEYRRYATYLHRFDPDLEFVACGHTTREWNPELLDELRDTLDRVDHLSIHRYVSFEGGRDFSSNAYLAMMGHGVDIMEQDVRAAAGALRAYTRDDHDIGVALDEWGVWHPEAVNATGLSQPNTLRDGLFAASSFNMFHRHADVLTMTNIAQTINVLQCLIETDGADMALTPTYHVYDMLKGHQGATSLETTVVTPSIDYEWEGTSHALPLLDASASRADNGAITLSVVNRDPVRILDAEVSVATEIQAVSAVELTGPATNSENRPGQTPTVTPRDVPVACDNGILRHPFPPRSVTVMTIVP